MKKALLVLGALVMVFSGVAMVSAYEAHIVNVTAHPENAMQLSGVGVGPDYEYDFGTVFPEEWRLKTFIIGVSDSFCATQQQRMRYIDYEVWVEAKDGYYWLGDALYFVLNWDYDTYPEGPKAADMTWVGTGTPPIKVLSGNEASLDKEFNIQDYLTMALDVPVFEGYYNENTDPNPKPSGKNEPTVVIGKGETRYPADMDVGVDLGADVKIQVINIRPYP